MTYLSNWLSAYTPASTPSAPTGYTWTDAVGGNPNTANIDDWGRVDWSHVPVTRASKIATGNMVINFPNSDVPGGPYTWKEWLEANNQKIPNPAWLYSFSGKETGTPTAAGVGKRWGGKYGDVALMKGADDKYLSASKKDWRQWTPEEKASYNWKFADRINFGKNTDEYKFALKYLDPDTLRFMTNVENLGGTAELRKVSDKKTGDTIAIAVTAKDSNSPLITGYYAFNDSMGKYDLLSGNGVNFATTKAGTPIMTDEIINMMGENTPEGISRKENMELSGMPISDAEMKKYAEDPTTDSKVAQGFRDILAAKDERTYKQGLINQFEAGEIPASVLFGAKIIDQQTLDKYNELEIARVNDPVKYMDLLQEARAELATDQEFQEAKKLVTLQAAQDKDFFYQLGQGVNSKIEWVSNFEKWFRDLQRAQVTEYKDIFGNDLDPETKAIIRYTQQYDVSPQELSLVEQYRERTLSKVDPIGYVMGNVVQGASTMVTMAQWLPNASPEFKAELAGTLLGYSPANLFSMYPGGFTMDNFKDPYSIYKMAQREYSKNVPVAEQIGISLGITLLTGILAGKGINSFSASRVDLTAILREQNNITTWQRSLLNLEKMGLGKSNQAATIRRSIATAGNNLNKLNTDLFQSAGKEVYKIVVKRAIKDGLLTETKFRAALNNAQKELSGITGADLVKEAADGNFSIEQTQSQVLKYMSATKNNNLGSMSQEALNKLITAENAYSNAKNRVLALQFKSQFQFTNKMIGKLPVPTDIKDMVKLRTQSDKLAKIAIAAKSSPMAKFFNRMVNPASKNLESQLNALSDAFTMIESQSRDYMKFIYAEVAQYGDIFGLEKGKFGQWSSKNIEHISDKAMTTNAVRAFEYSEEYRFNKNAPKEWQGKLLSEHPQIKLMQSMIEADRPKLFKAYGVEINKTPLAEGQHYINRPVEQTGGKLFSVYSRGNISQDMPRFWAEMNDAIKKGVPYKGDVYQAFYKTMSDSYRMVNMKQFTDAVKELRTYANPTEMQVNLKSQKAIVQSLQRAYNSVDRNQGKLYAQTIKSLKNMGIDVSGSKADIIAAIREKQGSAQELLDRMTNEYKAMEQLKSVKGVEGLEGLQFTKSDAKVIEQAVKGYKFETRGAQIAANVLTFIPNLSKFIVTGPDFGMPFTLGQALLGRNPAAWGKAYGQMLEAFWREAKNPINKSTPRIIETINNNRDAFISAAQKGNISFSRSEFMEVANGLGKVPIVKNIVNPFAVAADTFLDLSKLEAWKGMYKPGMSAAEAEAIGGHIEKMLGNMSSARLGLTATQQVVETMLFFAPRYYRSYLAMVSDCFRFGGGTRNIEALKSMASLQASLHLQHYAFATMLGQSPNLNPAEDHYLQVYIGDKNGEKVWMGDSSGIAVAINKLIGRSIADPSKIGTLGLNALRARESWATGTANDLILGKTYIGKDLTTWENFFNNSVIQRLSPMAVQDFTTSFQNLSMPLRITGALATFVGLQASPNTAYQDFKDKLDELSMKTYGMDSDKLKDADLDLYNRLLDSPKLRTLKDASDKENSLKGTGWDKLNKQWDERNATVNPAKDKWLSEIWKLDLQKQSRAIDIRQFRAGVNDASARLGQIIRDTDKKYPELINYTFQPTKITNDMSARTRAVYYYQDNVKFSTQLQGLQDEAYFSKLAELEKDFDSKFPGQLSYVRDALLEGRGLPDSYVSLERARYLISDTRNSLGHNLWDIPAIYMNSLEGVTDPKRQAEMMAIINERQDLFRNNPNMNAEAFLWGYTNSLVTDQAEALARFKSESMGMNTFIPRATDEVRNEQRIDQLTQEIDTLRQSQERQGKGGTVYSTTVRSFYAEQNRYNNALKSLADSYRSCLNSSADKIMTNLRQEAANFRSFAAVARQYAASHPDDTGMSLLLREIERTELYNSKY